MLFDTFIYLFGDILLYIVILRHTHKLIWSLTQSNSHSLDTLSLSPLISSYNHTPITNQKLRLYAIFKIATLYTPPPPPRPSFISYVERRKWDAWSECWEEDWADLEENQGMFRAKERYVKEARGVLPIADEVLGERERLRERLRRVKERGEEEGGKKEEDKKEVRMRISG